MRSAGTKGTEMKLIHILALVAGMASGAVSQTANPPAGDNKPPVVTTKKPSASTAKPAPVPAQPVTVGPAKNTTQTKSGNVPSAGPKASAAPSTTKKKATKSAAQSTSKATKPAAQSTNKATKSAAQTPSKPRKPAAKPTTKARKPAARPTRKATGPAAQSPAGNKSAPKIVKSAPAGRTAAASTKEKKPASKTEVKKSGLKATTTQKSSSASGGASVAGVQPLCGAHRRRDPFVSPIRTSSGEQSASVVGPPCTVGKRCLSIPDMSLHGTVKDINGKLMAVVLTPTRRIYLLSENDQILNGTVVKITKDAVTFREVAKDKGGHDTAHEVVKKIVPSS